MSRAARPRRLRRVSGWEAAVPVATLVVGLLFATSGQTARGTDLRAGDLIELTEFISQRQQAADAQEAELAELQARSEALTGIAGQRDTDVAAAQAAGDAGLESAGFTPLTGAGLLITLNDAPRSSDGTLPRGAEPDDLVIHQSDVQGVVNALWAAGADGVAIMGQRLIATSAVRCVGNTLLLQGRMYSPPFLISAIGDTDAMRAELEQAPAVTLLELYVARFGLTYQVQEQDRVQLPAYAGASGTQYAEAVP